MSQVSKKINGAYFCWNKDVFGQKDVEIRESVRSCPNDERVMIWKHKESRMMVVGIYAPVQCEKKWALCQEQTKMVREGQKEGYRGEWGVVLQEV